MLPQKNWDIKFDARFGSGMLNDAFPMDPHWFESPTSYRVNADLCRAYSAVGKYLIPPANVSAPEKPV